MRRREEIQIAEVAIENHEVGSPLFIDEVEQELVAAEVNENIEEKLLVKYKELERFFQVEID